MNIESMTFIGLVLLGLIFFGRVAISEGRRTRQKKEIRVNLKNLENKNK
jgi:hypothetical protein